MYGRQCAGRQRKGDEPAAVSGYAKILAEECLGCGRPERYDNARLDDADLGLEPRKAGFDLDRTRLAVDTARSARHPFEVLDDIGDVGLPAIDPGFLQAAVQQPARRADEGATGQVFGIARLLAHQHDPGSLRSFAENGLRCVAVEVAGGALSGGLA